MGLLRHAFRARTGVAQDLSDDSHMPDCRANWIAGALTLWLDRGQPGARTHSMAILEVDAWDVWSALD